ncbi:MAG: HD domain-containing phosphohydrolase [Pseudomonadota bacterium]
MSQEVITNITANTAEKPDAIGSILFVDDEENVLTSLRRLMRKQPVNSFFATSAQAGLELLATQHIDVIISDMRMPNMDGAEFLARCKEQWPNTVRILLTGHSDITATIKALNKGGIYRYLNKPWDDDELVAAIMRGLQITQLEKEKAELLKITQEQNEKLSRFNEELESRVKARTEEITQTADMLDLVYQQLKDSYGNFVKLFSSVIASRRYLDKTQTKRVAELAKKLALSLKLSEDEVNQIYFSGLLIDLGKLNLADDVLKIPEEKLTQEQQKSLAQHTLLADITLSAMPELEVTGKIIRDHMEAIDGSGFPGRLKGNAISRGSRILRVARDFVGLQSGLMKEVCLDSVNAFNTIKSQAGKIYDPFVVKALEPLSTEFDLGEAFPHEVKMEPIHLVAGLVVSRDIYNTTGILMISKNFKLTNSIIEKLVSINAMHDNTLKVFVYKEEQNKS